MPLEPEKRILGDMADVMAFDALDEDELRGKIEDADAIMVYHNLGLTRKTIERLEHCKLIVRCGVGYDNVDHALCRERGIPVANVPDYGTEEVADSAIGLMMALTRGISRMNSLLRDGIGPWMYTQVVPLHRLRGRVFGIVGLGRIGTAAALRAKALGMDVVFYDPYKPTGYEKALGIRRVDDVDELFAQSHVLSLHCPLTDETHHLVESADDRDAAGRGVFDQHGPRRGGRYGGAARGVGVGPFGRGGHRRAGTRAAAARSSVDRGLARSEPCGPPPPDHQSAFGLLQRRGPDGHANQGIERLPKGPVRRADSQRH